MQCCRVPSSGYSFFNIYKYKEEYKVEVEEFKFKIRQFKKSY